MDIYKHSTSNIHKDHGRISVSGVLIVAAALIGTIFAGLYFVGANVEFDDAKCHYTLFGKKVYEEPSCKPHRAEQKESNKSNENYGETVQERQKEGAEEHKKNKQSFQEMLDATQK